jgi:hypothetical protein
MPTRTDRVLKRYVRSRVDGHTIILVVHIRTSNHHIRAVADIKPIGVRAQRRARLVVDGHVGNGQPVRIVNRHGLHRRVIKVQVRDGRVGQIVRVEELGLGHAAVGALAVPVVRAVAVEDRAGRARDGDAGAFDLEQGSVPLRVGPGGRALEDDLGLGVSCVGMIGGMVKLSTHSSVLFHVGKVQCHPGGHTQGGQDDSGTILLGDAG